MLVTYNLGEGCGLMTALEVNSRQTVSCSFPRPVDPIILGCQAECLQTLGRVKVSKDHPCAPSD